MGKQVQQNKTILLAKHADKKFLQSVNSTRQFNINRSKKINAKKIKIKKSLLKKNNKK